MGAKIPYIKFTYIYNKIMDMWECWWLDRHVDPLRWGLVPMMALVLIAGLLALASLLRVIMLTG
jgi:hypothetical protein